MSLADTMTSTIGPIKEKAAKHIDGLAAIAAQLDMKDTRQYLSANAVDLRSDNFNIIMVGRFKNGKSTLMNALLGRMTHPVRELKGIGPMPTDSLPCTAALTKIKYAVTPYVKMHTFDGKVEDWSFEKYLRDAVVKSNEADTVKFFEPIMQFEVGLPAELCQSGVTLLDSPGLGDTPKRNEITGMAIPHCDAAIVVYRSEPFAGMDEIEFATHQVADTNTRVFTVINMYNESAQNVGERFKAFAWNRLVGKDRGGPEYNGQDFSAKDIYFVNAKEAFEGKMLGDAALIKKSGIDLLEQRLATFLLKERQFVHMSKFVTEADNSAVKIEATIGQRKAALQADQQKLQQKYKEIEPQLQEVRGRRDKISPLFDAAATKASRALRTSFQQMITQLRMDLPGIMESRRLSTEGNMIGILTQTFRQKKLCEEASAMCTEIIAGRLAQWGKNPPSQPGARQALEPIMEVLTRDLEDEAARIDRAMREIHFQMTGWTMPTDGPTSIVSTRERVLSALGSLAAGDILGVVGIGGGWRGTVGAVVGHVGSLVVLGAMGLLAAPIAIPAILITTIFAGAAAGGSGMGKRIRLEVTKHVVASLNSVPAAAEAKLDSQVTEMFKEMEREAVKAVQAVVDEEVGNIQKMLEMNKRSQADRDKALAVLNDMSNAVGAARQALKSVGVQLSQAA